MRLVLKDEKYTFTVTKAAEPRTEYGSGQQKMNRASKLPEWVVEVLAMDSERGEVIRVTVTGDQPKVSQGQPVRFEDLEAATMGSADPHHPLSDAYDQVIAGSVTAMRASRAVDPTPGRALVPRFKRATNDKFFICIEASDKKFDLGAATKFLESIGGKFVTEVRDED